MNNTINNTTTDVCGNKTNMKMMKIMITNNTNNNRDKNHSN